jgi:hypothetical protein
MQATLIKNIHTAATAICPMLHQSLYMTYILTPEIVTIKLIQ